MNINIEISGISPLLMNRFSMEEYNNKIKEKNLTPRAEAHKKLYADEEGKIWYPTWNIYACMMEAGRYHKIGKSKVTTMKSSLLPASVTLYEEYAYFENEEWEVDSRAVVVPSTGGRVICHRPRLDKWSLNFNLKLDTTQMSDGFLRVLMDDAGSKVGLGDFRPGRKGPFGRFIVSCWHIEEEDKKPKKK